MIIKKKIKDLQETVNGFKKNKKSVGFVPTMGALHNGHLFLINTCKRENDICICSIFINPAQFNNKTDFDKYPKTIENDIALLEGAGCDILFLPDTAEMYAENEQLLHYNLGFIETILEGQYRPGHFQGICIIVDKLLAAVLPRLLYLGRKDYQQCMVIQKMMDLKKYEIQLHICDTVREPDGLAMSSRNMRLNTEERKQAVSIIISLKNIQQTLAAVNIEVAKKEAIHYLQQKGFKVDYVEIADTITLQPVIHWDGKQPLIALVAAYINEVRLIDNIAL